MLNVGDTVTMDVHLQNHVEERTGRVIEIPKHQRFAVVLFKGDGFWGNGGYYRECLQLPKEGRLVVE